MLGSGTGTALVVSNMVGAGVFLSAGFLAQDLGPRTILLAWVAGLAIALAGALAYSELCRLVPRSGGEYRFLSSLGHPFLGFLAGWTSLLVGFSAPIAVDAVAAGAFANTLGLGVDPRLSGAALVVVFTAIHATALRSSKWTQNALVAVSATLLAGFAVFGLAWGNNRWPEWTPPHAGAEFPWTAFAVGLFYIAFAFSGWNAAAYAAEEFRDPRRNVPRAMLLGCSLVGTLYLMVNWVFVANLTPQRAEVVFTYESTRLTLGHLIATDLAGEWGGRAMSVLALAAFVAAMSAMTFLGPRMYAAMARDGFLPRRLAGRSGEAPAAAVLLQGGLALGLIFTHQVQQVLQNIGALLALFSALAAATLLRVRLAPRPGESRPSALGLTAAGLYIAATLVMLGFGLRATARLPIWAGAIAGLAAAAFLVSRYKRGRP